MLDIKALSESLLGTLKGYVERSVGALSGRIEAVERRVDALPAPKDGKDGHTPTAEEIQPLVDAAVAEAVKAIPQPADGKDGRTPTPEELQPLVDAAVTEAIKQVPAPADGSDGKDGHTPTPEELQPLVDAAVAEAVKAIPVPQDGRTPTAQDIQPLVDAAVAEAVKAVPAPKDGQPGRDALDLHILPAIDEAKAYPRGTYAKHQGGLWRSFEATEGMRGWECIVEGVAAIQVEQEGDRKFVVTMGMSSGAQRSKEFTLPVMIYRGVFREGNTYDSGDTVTWGGSTWTAKCVTDAKPGEGSGDWVLSVKKGRDAKPTEGVKV